MLFSAPFLCLVDLSGAWCCVVIDLAYKFVYECLFVILHCGQSVMCLLGVCLPAADPSCVFGAFLIVVDVSCSS